MYSRRITDRMIKYWTQLKKDQKLPHIQSFRKDIIQDIWPSCFEVSVILGGPQDKRYTYEHIGEDIVKAYGVDMRGQQVSSKIRGIPGERIISKLDEIVVRATPLVEDGIFINRKQETIKYRTCLLPFSNGTEKVTNIIAGISWLKK